MGKKRKTWSEEDTERLLHLRDVRKLGWEDLARVFGRCASTLTYHYNRATDHKQGFAHEDRLFRKRALESSSQLLARLRHVHGDPAKLYPEFRGQA